MNRKLLFPGIGLVCSVFLFACGSKNSKDETVSEDIIPVKLLALKQGSEGGAINASGLFTTNDETPLSFKTGGIVEQILVKEGDAVSSGQLLATLNPTEINAGLQQATLAEEKARRDYQRAYKLYKDSVATLEQMQNARTALDVTRQQLKAASFNRRFSEIRAPESGYVLQRYVNEGQVVGPGTPVLLTNGAGKGDWILKVGVSDRDWSAISKGDKATIYADVLQDRELQAYVYKKAEGIDPSSGTFVIQLKIRDKEVPQLASGMFAKAKIYPSRTIRSAWKIPYDALLDGDAGKGFVFVTNDKKAARRVEVKVGEIRKDSIVITGGLEDAGYLITSGSPYLNDGSKIKVQ